MGQYGYRLDSFLEKELGGRRADGYLYAYEVQGQEWQESPCTSKTEIPFIIFTAISGTPSGTPTCPSWARSRNRELEIGESPAQGQNLLTFLLKEDEHERERNHSGSNEKAGEPLNAGKVMELTGLDRKVVDKAFAAMKKEGSIVSPVRCKWEPAEK